MTRIEIVMDQTIEDIFIERIHETGERSAFTLVRGALGNGESGPRMGTAVWPEENSLFVLYIEEEGVAAVKRILAEMREAHPHNGISAFLLPNAAELFPPE